MTEDQLEEARRWVALRGWRWVAGMLARRVRDPWWEPSDQGPRVGRGHRVLHVEHVIVYCDRETFRHPSDDFLLDITDPATRGCLLALAREITQAPDLIAYMHDGRWRADYDQSWSPASWLCESDWPTETAAVLAAVQDFERAKAQRHEVTP